MEGPGDDVGCSGSHSDDVAIVYPMPGLAISLAALALLRFAAVRADPCTVWLLHFAAGRNAATGERRQDYSRTNVSCSGSESVPKASTVTTTVSLSMTPS